MKLSDLLKQKLSPGGGFSNQVLQNSINKSSPGFKQTTMNPNGTPVATDVNTPPTVPPPEPIRDGAGTPIATPVDWNANYAYLASQGDTAAQDWIDQNTMDEQVQTPTTDSSIDFSTPTTDVAYSMEKLNELYGTKSPEDLWALRQKLRLQESQASAGMLPAEEYMKFDGTGITDGAPRYNYDQQMGVNKSTADIFSTQVADLDKFMADDKKKTASSGLNTSGIPSQYASIINSSSLGKTADERDVNRKDLVNAAMEGDEAFIAALIGKGEPALTGEARKAFDQRITNAQQLDQFINAVNSGNIKLGNIKSIQQSVLKKFGAQSPEYAMANLLSGGVSAQERNRLFGASLTGTEKEDASQFIITSGDTTQIALDKARAMQATMTYANDISALTQAGVPRSEITMWQNQGKLKTLNDYLIENGSSLAKKPNLNDKNISYTERQQLKNAGLSDAQIDADLGFKTVGSVTKQAPKVVAGYDISSYATDPNHEASVASIYQRTPPFKTASDIDMVIRSVAPKSKITGQMVATAANAYGVDPKMVYAIMLQDSSLGTAGMGARNNNPGNIGQYDNLGRPVAGYQTLQGGVNAVAKWLSKKKVQQGGNYA